MVTDKERKNSDGRQRRRTFVLADEYAAWPFAGYPQHTALSQTTRSMVKLSTAGQAQQVRRGAARRAR